MGKSFLHTFCMPNTFFSDNTGRSEIISLKFTGKSTPILHKFRPRGRKEGEKLGEIPDVAS